MISHPKTTMTAGDAVMPQQHNEESKLERRLSSSSISNGAAIWPEEPLDTISMVEEDGAEEQKDETMAFSVLKLQQKPHTMAPPNSNKSGPSTPRGAKKTATSPYQPSPKSLRTRNPIRAIVDPIVAKGSSSSSADPSKARISLALGDPAMYDNLEPCQVLLDAAVDSAVNNRACRGYTHACGSPSARQAIAKFYSNEEVTVESEDVVVASGCSGALELALTALLKDNGSDESILLVPKPGFPLYQVIAESHGAEVVCYNLDSNDGWNIDLKNLEELFVEHGDNVRGLVVTNPSNPCGSVYGKDHLKDVLSLSGKYDVPIVSDEVYGDMTFTSLGAFYHPLGQVAAEMSNAKDENKIVPPVIMASGLGKQFLVPGWRLGWLVFFDYTSTQKMKEVNAGVKRLAQVILGASHLAQGVIPAVLDPQTEANVYSIQTWKDNLLQKLELQSNFVNDSLSNVIGLKVIPSSGAMYTMIRLDLSILDIDSDLTFTSLLLEEENVFVLPGSAFVAPGYFRVVYCAPIDVLRDATDRIRSFCQRHVKL
jgi:tyrosine aminotransferase